MGFSFFSDLISPTKYDVPDAPNIDVDAEQKASVEGNLSTFRAAKQLAQEFNDYSAKQVQARLKQNLPYMQDMESQIASNLGKRLRGELSLSDAAGVQRQAAASALRSGLNVGAVTARDLGLTQYGLQQQAEQQAPAFMQGMAGLKASPMFDFSSVFMTPAQRIQTQQWNKSQAWNVQNLQNQMDVQPEPWMKAMAGLGDFAIGGASQLAGTYAGSAASAAGTAAGGGGGMSY